MMEQERMNHIDAERLLAAAGAVRHVIEGEMHGMVAGGAVHRASMAMMSASLELAAVLGRPDHLREQGWSCLNRRHPAEA